jgi:rhodanese-related sulfurtransferase
MDLPYMEPIYIAFIIFLIARAYNYLKPNEPRNYTSLNTEEAWNKIKEGQNITIIDVRNKDEYKTEHIKRTKNIPLNQMEKTKGKLPKDKDVIVYCQNGGRSIRAIRQLEVAGFTKLFHMHEGLRGWKKADHPTIKRGENK